MFMVTDTRVQPRCQQQPEAQRKRQRPSFRYGKPQENEFGIPPKPDPEHSSY